MTALMSNKIDFADIQGLVRFGYGKLTDACYYLLRVRDAHSAGEWLRCAPVTSAVMLDDAPESALQVAFTSAGLSALSVPIDVMAGFSPEFLSGMADNMNRSRRLGDVAASAPTNWRWGAASDSMPHVVLMLFARPGKLDALKSTVESGGFLQAFKVFDCLLTSNLCGFEPFGFVDGVSQPVIDWENARPVRTGDHLKYENLVAIGEFLLGYANEYGKYTERPLARGSDPNAALPLAEDNPQKFDLGRNGTYVVFRQLKQDVASFWRYLDSQAQGDASVCTRLAEAMVGRKITGEALIPPMSDEIAGVDKTDRRNLFTYSSDPDGIRCPFGAHVRRANPRTPDLTNADGPLRHLLRTLGLWVKGPHDDLIASARLHRILRRGREYGPELKREDAIAGKTADAEQGLYFVCLNANIARQFEFVQNAWIMSSKFDGLGDEADPLLGNREPLTGSRSTDGFSLPTADGIPQRLTAIPQFVTVVGGAYFFMPGIHALRYISNCAR